VLEIFLSAQLVTSIHWLADTAALLVSRGRVRGGTRIVSRWDEAAPLPSDWPCTRLRVDQDDPDRVDRGAIAELAMVGEDSNEVE
jgi:hypothetical protein